MTIWPPSIRRHSDGLSTPPLPKRHMIFERSHTACSDIIQDFDITFVVVSITMKMKKKLTQFLQLHFDVVYYIVKLVSNLFAFFYAKYVVVIVNEIGDVDLILLPMM